MRCTLAGGGTFLGVVMLVDGHDSIEAFDSLAALLPVIDGRVQTVALNRESFNFIEGGLWR